MSLAMTLGGSMPSTLASLTVLGALAVGGGATIVGELTSESVYETLNSDKTSGAPTEDMGFRARRGASPWWVIGWDETNDRTIIGTSTDGTVANTTGGAVVVGSVLAGNGTAAAPSYTLSGDPDSGFYSYSANIIGVALGGAVKYVFAATQFLPITTGSVEVGSSGSRFARLYLGGNTPAVSTPFLDGSQTWNDAGVAFIGVKWVFTNTASAATSFPFQIYGGAAGTTALFTVMVNGDVVSGGWLRAGTNVACAAASYLVVTNRLTIGASADGVATLQNYAANDFTRLCFGGITSAFGALGRDGAGIKLIGGDGTTGIFLSGIEQTAPAAPAANGYRIYAEDNGAGKTRLMCLFGSGAAQQLAIEP